MDKTFILMTDSSADLPPELIAQLGLDVIPLSVNIENETFLNYPDERDISTHEFYEKLRGGANATTSAANVETFLKAMSVHLEQGLDVLYLGFSSGLSSTYNASEIAAQELSEKYPERTILTVDTLCASLGQGLLVYLTAQEIQKGASIEDAAQFAEDTKLHLCHWFTVDDLFFLKRGGRVSATTALLGTALGIKPVLHVDDEGHLINVSKARGRKNSILALADRMAQSATNPSQQTIFISHGDCLADAEFLANYLRDRYGLKDIVINYVGPVIGAHSGPGTLALFFVGSAR